MNGGAYMAHNHEEILCKVKTEMPGDELICDLADLFKIFGDTTRMKILYSLFESELCVCAIAELLGMTQSAISHQLKVLKNANLVANRREGKTIYYFLADGHVRDIVAQGFEHLTEKHKENN
jgi:ArsR family transcriptional regulator